jgi:hypothetical protein
MTNTPREVASRTGEEAIRTVIIQTIKEGSTITVEINTSDRVLVRITQLREHVLAKGAFMVLIKC